MNQTELAMEFVRKNPWLAKFADDMHNAIYRQGLFGVYLDEDQTEIPQRAIERFFAEQGETLAAEISDRIADTIQPAIQPFEFSIDYDLPLDKLVNQVAYSIVSKEMLTDFRTTRQGKSIIKFCLISFKYPITSADVLRRLSKLGMHPAEFIELLAFCQNYTLPKQRSVVALGSKREHNVYGPGVPFLSTQYDRNDFYIQHANSIWSTKEQFAAVLKVSN